MSDALPISPHPTGEGAPRSLADVQSRIHDARERGWAWVHDSSAEGISAMAAPLVDPDGTGTLGVVSIAGLVRRRRRCANRCLLTAF
jgi:DNA-binding IclR family transcriptional regulator